jgi:hypothetical protein
VGGLGTAERPRLPARVIPLPYKHRNDQNAAVRDWRKRYPDKWRKIQRANRLKLTYGITPEQYDEMLAQQQHRCAICLTSTPPSRNGFFSIDHDHSTGKIRGLLCDFCNRGLGLFRDSPTALRLAADYLERANADRDPRRHHDQAS